MLRINKCLTEYQNNPLGIDCEAPRFSWVLVSDENDTMQTAYSITVSSSAETLWELKNIMSDQSVDITYNGKELLPCTQYKWKVEVKDNHGNTASGEGIFETGLMDSTINAWNGAKWIGEHKPSLCSQTKGVFVAEAKIKIDGTRAGIIFGADDERLNDINKNIMGVCGENYIAYEIDISTIPAKLLISRVGYSKDDSKNDYLSVSQIKDIETEVLPITEENKNDWHTLRVEVTGNTAKAYVDDYCVDAVWKSMPFLPNGEKIIVGRQLNPLSDNNTITFPRLHKIGFTEPKSGNTYCDYYKIKDFRYPCEDVFVANFENNTFMGTKSVNKSILLTPEDIDKYTLIDPSNGGVPVFRKKFELKDQIIKARLYITSRGIYDCEINGEPVDGGIKNKEITDLTGEKRSGSFLNPGASQFDKHLFYNTYDVTRLVSQGENGIGLMISSGWWSDSQTFSLENHNYFGNRPSFLLKLQIEYENGDIENIVSDTETWKYTTDGPIRFSGYFSGERYDSRNEEKILGYSMASFDDSGWINASEVLAVPIKAGGKNGPHMWPLPNYTEPKIIAHPGTGVEVVDVLTAKSVNEVRPGIYVYDMEQNMIGIPLIRVNGVKGQKIWIRYGETMYPYLEEYGELQGTLLTENLRDAESNDIFICKGGEEVIFPKFTFHGYRYVEISGVNEAIAPCDVHGVVISSFVNRTGDFSCNNKDINRLFQNVLWSQRANFVSIPTDCPQRNERMGWMGDAQVFAPTAAYNDDVRMFFERYLISARDLQDEDGKYPCIAPVGGGFGGIAWESAGLIIPWAMYNQYGDRRILEENFSSMVSYCKYLEKKIVDDIVCFDRVMGNLPDWLASDLSTDGPLIWDCIAIYDMDIIAKSAKILGCYDVEEHFNNINKGLKRRFNEVFFNNITGRSLSLDGKENDTQCSYALPLAYDIYNDENKLLAAKRLNDKTIELGYTLTTGFIGTPCIAPALTENGYIETAYKLLCQSKYPSWLYPITQGATTIWERWNSYTVENGFGGNNAMNSFNHYSLGAVGYWLYSSVLGIKSADNGFKNIVICPQLTHIINDVKGYYESEYGTIKVSWNHIDSIWHLAINVPANVKGKLVLPEGFEIQDIKVNTFELVSGEYQFNVIKSYK